MTGTPPSALERNQAQLAFASVLSWASRLGLAALVAGFAAYVLGWLQPQVPMEQLPQLWSHPAADYLRQTGIPGGWAWLDHLAKGDVVNLVGIALLAGAPMFALLAAVPSFAARRAYVLAAICVLEIAVLLLAASALLGSGR